jgi:hypothetical protein
MTSMERERKSGMAAAVAVLLLLLPLLYLLSAGPAVWLHRTNFLSERAFVVYLPIEWAAEISPQFAAVVSLYVDLWDGPDVGIAAPPSAPVPVPPVPAPPTAQDLR